MNTACALARSQPGCGGGRGCIRPGRPPTAGPTAGSRRSVACTSGRAGTRSRPPRSPGSAPAAGDSTRPGRVPSAASRTPRRPLRRACREAPGGPVGAVVDLVVELREPDLALDADLLTPANHVPREVRDGLALLVGPIRPREGRKRGGRIPRSGPRVVDCTVAQRVWMLDCSKPIAKSLAKAKTLVRLLGTNDDSHQTM